MSDKQQARTAPIYKRKVVPLGILTGTGLTILLGATLAVRAQAGRNHQAVASSPKLVSVVNAEPAFFQDERFYVGTIEPWQRARVGPQLISGYVDNVLVRPGDPVKRGQVLATLDCRNASAASQAIAMQAKALEAEQQAIEHESTRVQQLLNGGFVSPNEAEQKRAQSAAQQAQLLTGLRPSPTSCTPDFSSRRAPRRQSLDWRLG